MKRALLALALMAIAAPAAAQETIKVKRPDFDIPESVLSDLPADIPLSEIFVTDDLCFYYRRDGAFHFLNCIG